MNFIPVSGKKGLTQEDDEIITDWLNKNTYFRILETSTEAEANFSAVIYFYIIFKLQYDVL